jgi:hypothetical protein
MNQNRFILGIANLQISQIRPHSLVEARFSGAQGANARTRDVSLRDGRLQTGEAGLRDIRRVIANTLKIPENKVQISIIRAGGTFDSGPQTPLSFGFRSGN